MIPGLGRSPGGGNNNWFQYFYLGNLIERGTQWASAHRVTKRVGHDWVHAHTHAQSFQHLFSGLFAHKKEHSLMSSLLYDKRNRVHFPSMGKSCSCSTVLVTRMHLCITKSFISHAFKAILTLNLTFQSPPIHYLNSYLFF